VSVAPVSVVSGGSRGLGLAVVEALLDRGDRVATFSRSGSPTLATLAAHYPERLHAALCDAADSAAIRAFVADVAARFGRIDHCIASAAIAHEGVLATMRDDEIDEMLAVNVKGSIVLVRECVRQMLIQRPQAGPTDNSETSGDGGTWPSVTLISSLVASRGSPGLSVYAATKAALEGFAISVARELGSRGIRVNAVAPGFLETDLSATLSQENRKRVARRTALGRLGTAADVVGTVLHLTDGISGFLTGQVIAVDGGS
jgi:3-oxoacyl-[acyl-carrier protein] reductase